MWGAEIAVPGIINASKRNTRVWSNEVTPAPFRPVGNAHELIPGISIRAPLFRWGESHRLVAVGRRSCRLLLAAAAANLISKTWL
jgi:hypothetical protein